MKLRNVVLSYCALAVNLQYSLSSNIPTLFNINNNSTSEGTTTAEELSCESLGYNLNDECVKVRINFALLDSVITSDQVGVQFKLFDDNITFTNQIVTNYKVEYSHGMNPYKIIELSLPSLDKGLIIIDNNRTAATYSDINGTVIVQPCNDIDSGNECYMAIKIASENLNKLDIPKCDERASFQSSKSSLRTISSQTNATETADIPAVLTISFAFAPTVASSIGEDNLRLRSATLVEVMNQAMKNSQVDNILQLRLQEAFVYNGVIGPDASTTLFRFSGTDTKGAHVAALVVSGLGYCGIAHFYCAQYSSPQLQSCPYYVLDQTCMEYSVAHEFGHILGMQHDRDNGVSYAFPFGQGYIDATNKIRTIMAYPSGDTRRIGYYSSNSVKTPEGYALGDDNKNNRQVLILTAKILADKLEALRPKTTSPTAMPSTLSPVTSPTLSPTETPPINCPPNQQVLPNLVWNEKTLAASLINSAQKSILFTINNKPRGPYPILKLNLLCTTNSSNIIITGNGPKKLRLKNKDRFLIKFNDNKHATVSVFNVRNNLKLMLPIESQCEFNGLVKYAGRSISQLSNVKCYVP